MPASLARPARPSLTGAALLVLGLVLALAACGTETTKLRVTGVEPRTGDANGGTRVEVSGSNFRRPGHRSARIYFGEQQGTVLRSTNSRLLVEAPGGKAGESVDVLVVFEPGGEITIPRGFTYQDRTPVQVRDLSPQ